MNDIHIGPDSEQKFLTGLALFNIQRGKLFAVIIMSIELVLLLVDIFSRWLDTTFRFNCYALMYMIMIIVTACMWYILTRLEKCGKLDPRHLKMVEPAALVYLIFLMSWGAVIALLDQDLYANVVAYLVIMLVGSSMFYIKHSRLSIPLLISAAILMIGLPFFQPSRDILIGHYVNTAIFLIFSWVTARSNYRNYVKNFSNQQNIEEKSVLLTRINDELRLEIQSRIQAQKELEAANAQLTAISSLDALTGIPNRRKLDELYNRLWPEAVKEQIPIAVFMIDIDFFKLYNDCSGHPAGDRCLQSVAGVLNGCRRDSSDLVARVGGEEFLFAATGLDKNQALLLGEKIRTGIESLCLEHPESIIGPYITASVGINWIIPGSTDRVITSIERSDQALYQAKQDGRNRVVIYGE
ncbi:MAG: diguanylate cyclase [Syntrophomonadaceae bacterium]|nr:diguanylate cyclase [Syntrophomonadaceae bacterium]MDD3023298.1 diguanylate cyclase [Syntrophomonadaceae bacterium]